MDSLQRPKLQWLSGVLLERILAEAMEVLSKVGVLVENDQVLALLADAGARIDKAAQRACLSDSLVWRCVRSAPALIRLFDRDGTGALQVGDLNVHFNPGSAALKILDSQTGDARLPVTHDLVSFARLADGLPNIQAQSTALVPSDVPADIADRYRLLIILLNSAKPVVTGTFAADGFQVMKEMLVAVAGGEEELRRSPRAIFDACSTQPLKWSDLTSRCLVECARAGIPAEIISAPLLGATAPLTLSGALVQHTAENLSGIVIHQLAAAGSPVIYGGSAAVFDMRHGTTALGAVESAMVASACAQIGRFLGLPTHGYLGLSDSKVVDAQCGLESGIGATIAALSGINMVSGAGMLEFENCQSLEKLVIDDEICGMARRLVAGIEAHDERLAEDLFSDLSEGDHFLASPVTLRWLRQEVAFPGHVIDRQTVDSWQRSGRKNTLERARERVSEVLTTHKPKPLPEDLQGHLIEIAWADAKLHGVEGLPLA